MRLEKEFFDVRIFHHGAKYNQLATVEAAVKKHEDEVKRVYNQLNRREALRSKIEFFNPFNDFLAQFCSYTALARELARRPNSNI